MRRLYGRIIGATGWTLPDVDALTWGDVEWVVPHWREEPPVGDCIRAYLGIEGEQAPMPSAPSEPEELSQDEFERLKAQIAADAERNGRARR